MSSIKPNSVAKTPPTPRIKNRLFDNSRYGQINNIHNINNIEKAVKISNPPAIDISSGVEISKGIKDPEMIKNFITKCRNI